MVRKVNSTTAQAARKIAREQLGIKDPKLRPATTGEHLKSYKKSGFDTEQVRDTVVVEDRQNGREFLLGIDVDPAESRLLNAESGVLTLAGLVPVIGAPVVAGFALKDIIRAGVPMIKARLNDEATDPTDRAILRMGLKHMGFSALTMATHTLTHGAHAAHAAGEAAHGATHAAKGAVDVAKIAHNVHLGTMAAEVVVGAKDINEATEKGDLGTRAHMLGHLKSFGEGIKQIWRSVAGALTGLAETHHPVEHHKEDARLIFAEERKLGGGKLDEPSSPALKKSKQERPPSTGPPPPE